MKRSRRIGFNLLYLVPGETGGTETYARMLIREIRTLRPEWDLVGFVGRGGLPAREVTAMGARAVELPVPSSGRFLRVVGEQTLLPRAARRERLDLLHNLAATGPRFCSVPQVTSTHDVIYASHPDAHSRLMRFGQSVLVPSAARVARQVLTISKASADEIVRVIGIPRDRIDVIPIAARTPGIPTPERELRDRLGLGDVPIVLATSARRGHKNLGRLLEAFARVNHEPEPLLVLPGYSTGVEQALTDQISSLGVADRVRLLGWISDADLDGLYSCATMLAFPSLAEGFGLPVLEAMAHGLPVATSNVSAMPEVGGDAAEYFDPLNVDEIASAIERLLGDAGLRERLAAAGRDRAAEFSWQRAAEQTVESYERVLADG